VNQLPNADQRDEGYFTRVLILKFNNRFLINPDPNDARQMKADPRKVTHIKEQEKNGILNWMLEGLSRLLENCELTIPESSVQALEDYKLESNTVLKFVKEQCDLEQGSEEGRSKVYQVYSEWCQQNGHRKVSAAKFYNRIITVDGVSSRRTAQGRFIAGIRLR
jgi:putative DNA primase/helicase